MSTVRRNHHGNQVDVPSRRRFLQYSGLSLAVIASGGLLAACGDDDSTSTSSSGEGGSSSGGEVTTMKLQLSWLPDTEFAPLFLADANKHFEEGGVKVEFIPGGPDIGAIEAIVGSGAADIGIATDIYSVITAIADGSPFVVLGALYPSNLHGFISKQDAPISKAGDLAGKKIGGPQGVQPKFDAIFELNGLDKGDYTFVPAGFGPDLLINGDVDTQSVFITDEVIAYEEATGEPPVILTWDELGLPGYTLVIFTTKDYLAANRDALKAFLGATLTGFEENKADVEAGPKLVADVYGTDAGLTFDAEVKKNEKYLPLTEGADTASKGYMYVNGEFLESDVYPGMEAAGLKTAPVADVLDMSLLEELHAG
jgi:NitT/TauT family transport system substrate-binding protein